LEADIQKFETLDAAELTVQDLEWLNALSEPEDEDSDTAVEWMRLTTSALQ
jgi:hypothetical protein